MLEDVVIGNPKIADEFDTLIKLSEEDRKKAAKRLKELDEKFGHSLDKSLLSNSYENDDYLFVADMLQDIRELHKQIHYDSYNDNWIQENSEIPYIHFDFFEEAVIKKDEFGNETEDDEKLNMRISGPLPNNTYKLTFNYYWLKRYIFFLETIFDENEEIIISLDDISNQTVQLKTYSEILQIIADLNRQGLKKQADSLKVYANSFVDNSEIPCPVLMVFKNDEIQIDTWSFIDEDGNLKIPLKKTIYNTSGFVNLFNGRNTLISEIFFNSLKMMLAHEVAHVARAHLLLKANESEYYENRNVSMNLEINADWTAATWLISELLCDTVDGDPCSPIICYTKKDLIYLLSVRVFAAYLSLSWFSRNDDRIWFSETITEFVNKNKATHPIYQFRTFCMLNKIKELLDHMGRMGESISHCLYTADNCLINKSVFDEVWKNVGDMIFSFEYSFRACWNLDERNISDKIRDNLMMISNAHPDSPHKMPFYMCYMEEAQEELKEYEAEWDTVLDKLRKLGMFFNM